MKDDRIAELEKENAIFRAADYEALQSAGCTNKRIAELEAENLKIKTKETQMNDTAYKIATSIMMDMLDAIDSKDREAFRKCLDDARLHNAIVGNTAMTERYCALCIKALKVFV